MVRAHKASGIQRTERRMETEVRLGLPQLSLGWPGVLPLPVFVGSLIVQYSTLLSCVY